MKKLIAQRHLVRQNFLALIAFSLCFYFCYHTMLGQRSVIRLMALEKKVTAVSEQQDSLEQQRTALEKKVMMMRPGSIDRDLLEERVRSVLGYSYSDEKILLK